MGVGGGGVNELVPCLANQFGALNRSCYRSLTSIETGIHSSSFVPADEGSTSTSPTPS